MDRQLLSRATENSDAPTPGYMYLDIAKNAASNPQTCAEIAKYLTNRLASKNNPNVKHKCLKVIAKTATSPYLRGQFKRCLAQDPSAMQAIKDATQYRGPPDPVRGDQPYQKVRDAAKEALDAVYSDTPPDVASGGGAPFSTSVSSTSHYGQPAGGYGGAQSGGMGGPGRRMEGIGNPMFKDPRLEPQPRGIGQMTVNDIVSEAKETVIGIIKDPLAKNVDVRVSNHLGSVPRPGGSYAGPGGGAYNSPPPGRSDIIHQTNGEWTMASNRGPGAVGSSHTPANYGNDSAYYKSRDNTNSYSWAQQSGAGAAGGVGGSWGSAGASSGPYGHQATPSISVNHNVGPSVVTGSGGGTAVSDGSYEKQLVMELCPPGGMKAEPPPDKLASFSRQVASLNADFVCPVLLDCLEDGQPWIIRAKALWVMEVCIQKGQRPDSANNPYADFFHACSAEIAPLANHARVAIRDPAKRVLNALGVATPVGGFAPPLRATAAAAPTAPQRAPVTDLLDFDFGGDTPEPTPVAPPPTAPPPPPEPTVPSGDGGGGSLFGGLNVAGAPVSAPPAPPAATAAPPVSAPAPPSDSLLDLMDAPNASTAAVAAPATSSSFSFMNGDSASSPAPAAEVKEAATMFDNMSIKTSEATAAPSSAFDFMKSTGSSDTTDKKIDSPANVAGRDVFDPLKHKLTPTTQQKMMQVSPEQMQAMMYQQMMMQQQQMQMAQMMAMQQAAQKRGPVGPQMFMTMPGRVMQNPAASKSTFAFMDQPQKPVDHSFDFVQDALKKEKK